MKWLIEELKKFPFSVVVVVFLASNVYANQLPPIVDVAADVDPHSGSANLGLPILTPPGRGGVEPSVSLQYNSRLGNSILGVGWTLELGAIQRSTARGVPSYNSFDTFSLLQTGSTQDLIFDSDAGFYRTELEGAFSKIIYDTTLNSWRMTDRNGITYFFGQTPQAREYDPTNISRVFKWLLNRVEDPHGNYMEFNYIRDGNRLYPQEIVYTGNEPHNIDPHAQVQFELEARPDAHSSFISGFERRMDKRIKNITVSAMIDGVSQLYRKYEVIYEMSSKTNRSLFKQFIERGDDGMTALPIKEMTYADNAPTNYSLATITDDVPDGDNRWFFRSAGGFDHGGSDMGPCPPPNICWGGVNWNPEVLVGDSSGNVSFTGLKDTAYWLWTYVYVDQDTTIVISHPSPGGGSDGFYLNGNYSASVGHTWNLKAGYNRIDMTVYSQNTNYVFFLSASLASKVDFMNSTQLVVPRIGADYNGDGITDAGNFDPNTGIFSVGISSSEGFAPLQPWITNYGTGGQVLVGHFDNNGFVDLVNFNKSAGNWIVALNDGEKFVHHSNWLPGFGANKDPGAADFNGDGATDIYVIYNSGSSLVMQAAQNLISSGSSLPYRFGAGDTPTTYTLGVASAFAIPGDFNADGLTDFASFEKTSGNWQIRLNPGNMSNDFILLQTITNFGANFNPVVADYNADGLSDIGYYDHAIGKVRYRINKGTIEPAEFEFNTTHTLTGPAIKIQTGDYNEDGVVDVVAYNDIGTCDLSTSQDGEFADLLTHVANGIGGSTQINYGSSAQYDNTLLPFITNVVESVTTAVAQGDTYTNQYFYEGGLWEPFYREFRGFGKVIVRDPQNNESITKFLQPNIMTDKFYHPDYAPWHAFDDWAIATGYAFAATSYEKKFTLQYDFGVENEQIIQKYTLKNSNGAASSPQDWTFEGSMNARQWNVLDARIGQAAAVGSGNAVAYSFTNTQKYRFYRLNVTASGSSQYIYIDEMEMMDSTSSNVDLTSAIQSYGNPREQASYDANGNLFSKSVNTWAIKMIGDFVQFPFLKRKDNFVYDGNATGRRTAEEFFYEDSPQYGNLTKAVQLGEVDLLAGNDMGADKRSVESTYLNNTTAWLLGTPSQVVVKDNAGTIVRQSWFFYDGAAYGTAPTKGLLTKKEEWSGNPMGHASNPKIQYSYDSVGNLLTTTDPLNRVTQIVYDPQYFIFPLLTRNALTHEVTNTYYGIGGEPLNDGAGLRGLWGQLKSTTDPNDQVGKRVYDTFGRTIASISPLDSVAKPTSTTEYQLTSTYTKITSSQRVKHGQDQMISATRFIDGVGREIQSKSPSGVVGQYVVSNLKQYNTRGLPEAQYLPYFTNLGLDTLDSINTAKPKSSVLYDAMGRAVQTTNPDGSYATVVYDDWTTRYINENGHKQESSFDAYGRLIEKREYVGADGRAASYYPASPYTLYATTHYSYDSEGNLVQTQDAQNNVTTITYDKLGRKIAMNDPDMGVWNYAYDLNGNLTQQTDAKGKAIAFTYDAINRLTQKADQTNQTMDVDYQYDAPGVSHSIGRLVSAVYGTNQSASFSYDKLGRETASGKVVDAQGFGVGRAYDALNHLIEITYPDQKKIYYDYNEAGQIEAVADDATLLDQQSFLTDSISGTMWLVEGRQALPAPIIRPPTQEPARNRLFCRAFEILEEVVLGVTPAYAAPTVAAPSNLTATAASSSQINLTWTDNSNNETGFKIERGNGSAPSTWTQIATVGVNVKTYSNTGLSAGTIYSYRVRAYKSTTHSTYSNKATATTIASIPTAPSGLTAVAASVSQINLTWTDNSNNETGFKIERGNGSAPSSWTQIATVGANVKSYSNTGLKVSTTYSYRVRAYNGGGNSGFTNMATATTPAPSNLFIKNVEYNATGQITRLEYGNGDVITQTFDPLTLRLTRKHTVSGQGQTIQDLNYIYDPAGNIVRINDYVNTATQDFQYDALGRLVAAIGNYGTKNYAYDTIGNIMEKDGKTYTYGAGNAGPHAVTSLSDNTTFTYDANGNMATRQKAGELTEYIYDVENRLKEVKKNAVSQAVFSYDGDGGRTKKVTANGITKYVGALYEERNGAGSSAVFLGDLRITTVTNGIARYMHSDHLGGTNVVTDVLGVKKELVEYLPFGEIKRHEMYGTGAEVAHFYFTGKELDEEAGLYFYGARYYDSGLGRFVTPDTLVQAMENPVTLNRYMYVGNNPINLVDPTGNGFFSFLLNLILFSVVNFAIDNSIHSAISGNFDSFNVENFASSSANLYSSFFTFTGGGLAGAAEFLLKASAAVQLTSYSAEKLGFNDTANDLSFAAQSIAAAYVGINVGVGVRDWIHEGRFAFLGRNGKPASPSSNSKIGIKGIGPGNGEGLFDKGANILADNPSSGYVADFTEAFLQKITFTSSVDRQLANALRGLENITLIGYSQGAIIASNTILNLGLSGNKSVITNARYFANPLSFIRTGLSAAVAGLPLNKVLSETKILDPINLVQPNLNPIGLIGGAIGAISTVGFKTHSLYSY